MKKLILIFLFSTTLFAQSYVIKSLKVYSSGNETSLPIIVHQKDRSNSITIEFDVQSDYQPGFKIHFKFCDKNWQPTQNLLLTNPGFDTEYNLSFDRLPATIKKARYHYKGSFPNKNVTFPYSGNWMFFIIDNYEKDKVYATGRFYVVYPKFNLNVSLKNSRLEDSNLIPSELGRTFTMRTNFYLPDTLFPSQVEEVQVIENQKIDYPIVINRDLYNQYRYYEWNGSGQFSFIVKNIFPGNEYRNTDSRNENRFPGPLTYANIDRVETSRFYNFGGIDLNGGSKLKYFKNEYSDYIEAVFQIRPPEDFKMDIYLVGAFTDWQILPEFKMFNDNGLYGLSVDLKRGSYDYQYVAGYYSNGEIVEPDWLILEGNFWQTENDYYIFLYYESTNNGGYDQIIGFKKINSGNL